MQGVNASEMEVVLREGRPKEELLAEMRRAVALIPGVAVTFGQPISHRIDHMISGSKTNLAVKIFGPDLAVLRGLAADAERRLRDVPGIVDLSNQEQQSVPQLLIDFDRAAMARLRPLARPPLARGSRRSSRAPRRARSSRAGSPRGSSSASPSGSARTASALDDLPVTRAEGRVVRLGEVARVRFDLGPGLVRRENVQRLAMLTANVAGADLAGTVERARALARGPPAAARLPGDLRRPVRGGGPQPAEPRASSPCSPSSACTACCSSPSATTATSRSSSSTSRSPSSAASPRSLLHGGVLSVASIVGLRHPLRHRHPQRRPAGEPLPAPDAGRGAAAARGGARAARASAWPPC